MIVPFFSVVEPLSLTDPVVAEPVIEPVGITFTEPLTISEPVAMSGPFIFVQPANSKASTKTATHQANSHAARAAHAKARLSRTLKYQQKRGGAAKQAKQNRGVRQLRLTGGDDDDHDHDEEALSSAYELVCAAGTNSGLPQFDKSLASDWQASFNTCLGPLNRRQRFLLDHYVKVVTVGMNTHCNQPGTFYDYHARATRQWAALALTQAGLFSAIMLSACRHLKNVRYEEDTIDRLATQFKLASIRSLTVATADPALACRDSTIATAVALALDDAEIEDYAASHLHLQGAYNMVDLRGGPQNLGLDGFLEHLYDKFIMSRWILFQGIRPYWLDEYRRVLEGQTAFAC